MKKSKNDIYRIIEEKSNYLFDKYDLLRFVTDNNNDNKENIIKIIKQKLYELNLNICNQVIYNYTYKFTKEDLEFIEKFDLYNMIREIIQITSDDLRNYKE